MALGQTPGCPRVNWAKKVMCSPPNTGNINFSLWLTGGLSQDCPDFQKVYVFKVCVPFSCPRSRAGCSGKRKAHNSGEPSMDQYQCRGSKGETLDELSGPLVHTNFPRKRYGPMIGPYVSCQMMEVFFVPHFVAGPPVNFR